MTVALSLSPPSSEEQMSIKELIVADIAPSTGSISDEFQSYLDAMQKVQDAKVKTRKEAMGMLSEIEPVSASD
jgi:hypothetical protein